MRLLRASLHRRMPWKNGGGETQEIACVPEGAGLDAFVWRASMARVERSGPFSRFAGIDRTLAVLEGEGLELEVEGMGAVVLRPGSQPFRFPADKETDCRLLGGPVTDLNIMTRRGAADHAMHRVVLDAGESLDVRGARLAVVGSGFVRLGDALLGAGDVVEPEGEAVTLHSDGGAVVFPIEVVE